MTSTTDIPSYSLPPRNRRVLLISRPTGIPQKEHFRFDEAEIPEPAEGQFVICNIYLSADPAQRGWSADAANYAAAVPIGGVMRALAVGVVTRSRCADVREGEFLYG